MPDDLLIARALHVLAVVHWIGGVGFVTLVILPFALSRSPVEAVKLFDMVERRFAAQVRVSIPLAGAAGLWMIRFPKDQFGNRIPLARKSALRLKDFRAISFSRIAKRSCGNRMTWRMDLWERFIDPHFWWMAAMAALWAVFMIMVFVVEPLAHQKFEAFARQNPAGALRRVFRAHVVLLTLAAITVLGAVAGSHGFYF